MRAISLSSGCSEQSLLLSLCLPFTRTHFHQTTAETEPALLMESRQSCLSSLSPFLFVYVHVGEQRLAGAEEQEYKRVFKKASKSSFKKSRWCLDRVHTHEQKRIRTSSEALA